MIEQNARGIAGDNRVNCNRIPRAAVYDIPPTPPGDSAGQKIALIATGLKGAVTCAVCPESAWLVTFLIGNVSTGVVTWSALRCGASGESGKKVAAAPLSKTAAAAAAAKTWFAKHPLDYMLHNRFPWKRSGRRSSMWPPYTLRRNLSAAACRPCDRSSTVPGREAAFLVARQRFPYRSRFNSSVKNVENMLPCNAICDIMHIDFRREIYCGANDASIGF